MYVHVWFVTKYRRHVITGEVDSVVKNVFFEVACTKGYTILEMETDGDHVHMLVEVKNRQELSAAMRMLKAVSAKRVLAFTGKTGTHFWAKRYGWRVVPKYQIEVVRTYIRKQKCDE